MTSEHEQRIYNDVLRDVLWGSTRESVFHMMEVNGITGDRAEELYAQAWAERVATVRSHAMQNVWKGGGILLGGAGVLFFSIDHLSTMPRGIFISCFVAGVLGGYWLIDGAVGALMASKKRGSVIDDAE